MKKLLKKFLVCILIVVIVGNFALTSIKANNVYAEGLSASATIDNFFTGLIRTFDLAYYFNYCSYFNWGN